MKLVRDMKGLLPEPGLKIGMITLISSRRDEKGRKLWKYQCSCGSEPREAGDNNVRMGSPRSCGCSTRHGPAPRQSAATPATPQRAKPELHQEPPQPRAEPGKPRGKQPVDNRLPWRPQIVTKPAAAPAERATGERVTYGPNYTHDPRYQVAEGAVVHGLFSQLGIGRYLDEARA